MDGIIVNPFLKGLVVIPSEFLIIFVVVKDRHRHNSVETMDIVDVVEGCDPRSEVGIL